ncbi:MAG: radical SAM protein [Candidatus Melainabacteria bacterium]|nr:radical SAM protein [Candidatus Melainabacteria bacterium]
MSILDDVTESTLQPVSSIYGPVHSWRLGWSLGVDLLLDTSTCSFNCIYCQLGDIQLKTAERKIYVPTSKVERDLRLSDWEKADIITLSGSGEPTLALNLGEVIHLLKEYTQKPVMVLTNATLLHNTAVQQDLMAADQVAAKLDAATDTVLQRMNRPVAGITLDSIVRGIESFRQGYPGKLSLQCMFMPANLSEAEALADIINRIQPDEVQLNTPRRPYPRQWVLDSRGNHQQVNYPAATLKTIAEDEAVALETLLREKTRVPVLSVYKKPPAVEVGA